MILRAQYLTPVRPTENYLTKHQRTSRLRRRTPTWTTPATSLTNHRISHIAPISFINTLPLPRTKRGSDNAHIPTN